ncbi:MAG: HD domain-containing protein, partial [Flavobacteriaceae bacterium]|nr:HD domain-containing protein [Flavobacteriaceae bacterium]
MSRLNVNKFKILNDPIYGFITIPNSLIFDLIEHPYFQRLRRISQMGLSSLVYPGAHHSRFHHAIGCVYLMQKAVRVLRFKGIEITDEEENALYVAILLHDIGHGAFSHALENSIVSEINHESISLKFMEALNIEFNFQLSLAIAIFKGNHPKKFLYQLISSQLDMDRLDYLKRDSFYSGVAEGNINSDRLIAMLNVHENELVIEEKGIYSVEKFIVGRRLMYWQVYLHKTGLAAELLLVNILKRAKELALKGVDLYGSRNLKYFLYQSIDAHNFDDNTLEIFAKLDDYDVLSAIKEWTQHEDKIISTLSNMLINRRLPKLILQKQKFGKVEVNKVKKKVLEKFEVNKNELSYYVFEGSVSNQAYNLKDNTIKILSKKGKIVDLAIASDQLNLLALSKPVIKYYIC